MNATLSIEGMHCNACAQRVKGLLEREVGVHIADVSFKAGEARVEYEEGAVTTRRLEEIVERAGYTARTAI